MSVSFAPADILKLALLMAVAIAAGAGLGLALRRLFNLARPVDWTRGLWIAIAFWAFGMLFSLIDDLTLAAGQPFWLKIVMLALLFVMVVGMTQATARGLLARYGGPSEPIRTDGPPKP